MSDRRITRLRGVFERLNGKACSGIGYRITTPKYANERDLLSGEGSRKHGGRWNPPGLRTVYLSDSPETALAESLAASRRFNVPDHEVTPRVLVAVRFTLANTIDLTNGSIRKRIGVGLKTMKTAQWQGKRDSLTQKIGELAFACSFNGLIVPSSIRLHAVNYVVFPANSADDVSLAILNTDQL